MTARPRSFVIIIAVALLAACSSVELKSAQTLATAGQKTATTLRDSVEAPVEQLNTYLDGEYLLSGLQQGYSPPSKEMLNAVESVQASLTGRASLFDQLGNTYSVFSELASYNASKDVEDSLDELTDTINSFSSNVLSAPHPVMSDRASGIISSIGGAFGQEIQKRRVKRASEEIRKRLEAIAALIKKDGERQAVTSVHKEIARKGYQTAASLWETGALDATPILRSFVSRYDLDIAKGQVTTGSNTALKPAVIALISGRSRRERLAAEAHYDASVAVVQRLIREHEKLENGEPMELGSLRERIVHLRLLLQEFNQSKQIR